RPVVYIHTDQQGRNNLPAPPAKNQSSSRSSFAVVVGHLLVRDAVLQYEDRQTPMSADVQGLRTEVSFNRLTHSYNGSVAYDTGRLQLAKTRTFDHKADMKFSADTQHLTIDKLDLATMHSNVSARGVLADFANPVLSGEYNARVVGDDLRHILDNAALPSGEIALQGKVNYMTAVGTTWADRTFVDGKLESAGLIVSTSAAANGATPGGDRRAAIRAVHGNYRLEHGQLHIDMLRAEVLGGTLVSDSDVIDLVRNDGRIRIAIKGASIQNAAQLEAVRSPETARISALADLDVDATWKKSPS